MQVFEPCVMSDGNLKEIVRKSRCDRCFRLHLKCDRAAPECNSCSLNPRAKCEYLRRIERKRLPKPTFRGQILVLKEGSVSAPSAELAEKFNNFEKMVRMASRPFLVRVLTFLQYPRLTTSPKLALFTANILSHVTGVRRTTPPPTPDLSVCKTLNHMNDLLEKAEDAFFENASMFLGLFPKGGYHQSPRSFRLRAAVFCCGLRWCEEDPRHKQAQDFLIRTLKESTTPNTLPLTLDSIQTLLVLMVGMFHSPWFSSRSGFFLTFALRTAHVIGLHLPHTFQKQEIERRLARNCLLYYVNYISVSDVPAFTYLPSMILVSPDWTLFYAIGLDSYNRVFSLYQETKLSLVEASAQLSLSEIHRRINQLKEKLIESTLKFMTSLYQYMAYNSNPPQFVRILISLFSFYSAYYRFLINSMYLYRTTNNFLSTTHPPSSHDYLVQTLDACRVATVWALNTKHPNLHWYFYAKLAQCVTFMSRHRHHLSPEDTKLIKKGHSLLKSQPATPQINAILKNMAFMKKLEFFDCEPCKDL